MLNILLIKLLFRYPIRLILRLCDMTNPYLHRKWELEVMKGVHAMTQQKLRGPTVTILRM